MTAKHALSDIESAVIFCVAVVGVLVMFAVITAKHRG